MVVSPANHTQRLESATKETDRTCQMQTAHGKAQAKTSHALSLYLCLAHALSHTQTHSLSLARARARALIGRQRQRLRLHPTRAYALHAGKRCRAFARP